MIKANELRVGNYVEYNPSSMDEGTAIIPLTIKSIYDVGAVRLNDGFDNTYIEDEINPIKLTPEILGKCGFENKPIFEGVTNGVYSKKGLKIGLHADDVVYDRYTAIFAEENLFTKVQYLHQLQNLYFALTGEELKVNL